MPPTTEFLASIPYFAELTPGELDQVAKLVRQRSYVTGEAIFIEGGTCDGLYLVKSGRVRIYKTSAEGREQVLFIARAGDSFNDVPIFDGGPNPATAETMEPSVVCIIPKNDLLALMRDYPDVAFGVLRVFASRLRHLTMLVEDLSFRHVTSRIAKILLQMVESDSPPLPGRLTQQQIAAMVGTAREMVNRSLRTLEQEGTIRIDGRQIVVLRPEALRSML